LDFPNIPYVFNFDLPSNIDDYIHRIGRTGRCGNKGTAFSFVTDTCRITKDLYKLLVKCKQEIPSWFESLSKSSDYSGNGNKYTIKKNFGNFTSQQPRFNSGFTKNNNYVTSVPDGFFKKGENFKREENTSFRPSATNTGNTVNNNYNNNYDNNSSRNTYSSNSNQIAQKFPRGNFGKNNI
jgi:ATP-dependent RNA helicase DDX3X